MAICDSCGGVIGQDCFNPEECAWIGQQQEQDRQRNIENRLQTIEKKTNMFPNMESSIKECNQKYLKKYIGNIIDIVISHAKIEPYGQGFGLHSIKVDINKVTEKLKREEMI